MPSNHHRNWSDKKKIEVVTSYLALGKAPMVEAVTGVKAQTIRIWKMQPWWKDLVREIQMSEDQELDGKLTKIIDKSLDVINDRLEKGEFILDSRSGTIKRVPVKLRDTHRVTSDLLDKRNVLRGKPTSITERVSTEDVLKKLAQQFQEFTKFQKTRLIESEDNNAVYDEKTSRESGQKESTREDCIFETESSRTTGLHERSQSEVLSQTSWETYETDPPYGTGTQAVSKGQSEFKGDTGKEGSV